MSGSAVMVIYEALPGQDEKLRGLIARHAPTLRAQGLLSDRPEQIFRAAPGVYLELIEWKSEDASRSAHDNPAVLQIWGSFEGIANFRSLSDLPDSVSKQPFPKFEAVVFNSSPCQGMTYSDNMIGARNYQKLVAFYEECFGLYQSAPGPGFTTLVDPISQQKLCIVDGQPVSRMTPGIATLDLEKALTVLESKGATVLKRWTYEKMIGANCEDPEGNEMLVWQEKK